MKNRIFTLLALCVAVSALMVAGFAQAQDDGRINVVGHFGGDTLYCNMDDGCTLLNGTGGFLWNVPQSVIDETFASACEVGVSQEIEAGLGTYGPSVIVVSCYEGYEPTLTLKAFDEHGKINELHFPQDYTPVTAPVAPTEEPKPLCLTWAPTSVNPMTPDPCIA